MVLDLNITHFSYYLKIKKFIISINGAYYYDAIILNFQ